METKPEVMETPSSSPAKRGGLWRAVLLLGVVLLVMGLAWYFEVGRVIRGLDKWIDSLGAWGPLAFIGIYAGGTVAALPGSVLTLAAGALFGPVAGVIYVSVASTLGASLCFLIARYFARDAAVAALEGNERFQRLDRLTAEHGYIIVALTRLVPIFPFNLLNYGFGLTRVSFGAYVFWSWLCMLPATFVFVAGIAAIKEAVAEGRIPWALAGAVAITVVILTLIVRKARSVLSGKEAEPDGMQPVSTENPV